MKKLSLQEYLNYLPKPRKDQAYLFYLISRDREAKKKLGFSIDKVLFKIKERENFLRAINVLLALRDRAEIFQVKGVKVEKEWLKIMHVLNPVNYVRASRKATIRFIEECKNYPDLEKIYFSELARTVDFQIFMIDVDEKNPELLESLKDIKPRLVMTTKRGFHVHVWKEDVKNTQQILTLKNVEVKTRNAIEYIPDIEQGGFIPQAYLIDDSKEIKELI